MTDMDVRKRQREREAGKRWARDLGPNLHLFIDQAVLGELSWLDWGFDKRPSRPFRDAAFDEAQYLEETGGD